MSNLENKRQECSFWYLVNGLVFLFFSVLVLVVVVVVVVGGANEIDRC